MPAPPPLPDSIPTVLSDGSGQLLCGIL